MICTAISQNGSKCTQTVDVSKDSLSQLCAHHLQMQRLLAMAPPKATHGVHGARSVPTSLPVDNSSNTYAKKLLEGVSYGATKMKVTTKKSQLRSKPGDDMFYLPGEANVASKSCIFEYPRQLMISSVSGTLCLTNFRIRFMPNSQIATVQQNVHPILEGAIHGIPWACVARVGGCPQGTQNSSSSSSTSNNFNSSSSGSNASYMPSDVLVLTFKDMREWCLRGDVHGMTELLNSRIFVSSPASLFAFATGNGQPNDPDQLRGHQIFCIEDDFKRMGVHLAQGPFRITEANRSYQLCPTYPKRFVVPSSLTDHEVHAVAEFRSKGRMPLLCWVHGNSASIWRSAQPKRGILNARNESDSSMLALIGHTNVVGKTVWIVDCRAELNARANNFTGGGTESSSMKHAKVTFMNIANIHSVRESYQALHALAVSGSTDGDLNWLTRVEETKWLYHLRLLLSASLKVARAVNVDAQTVLVHCSDGWDRTAQVCALAQLFLDPYYRTLTGFMQLIQKEWVSAGHKFDHRIAPGGVESEEQSPIFIQFLDCCWQLLHQFPTWFEFNADVLEFIADSAFSGRFGTLLCNCDRERETLDLYTRTTSLWSYILQHRGYFTNSFYRAPVPGVGDSVLLPPIPSVLRQLIPWSDYFFRNCPMQTLTFGNTSPPLVYGVRIPTDLWLPERTVSADLQVSMLSLQHWIQELEKELEMALEKSKGVATSPLDFIQQIPAPMLSKLEGYFEARLRKKLAMEASTDQVSGPPPPPLQKPDIPLSSSFTYAPASTASTASTAPVAAAAAASTVNSTVHSTAFTLNTSNRLESDVWKCRICSKMNSSTEVKCSVCGRGGGPSSSMIK